MVKKIKLNRDKSHRNRDCSVWAVPFLRRVCPYLILIVGLGSCAGTSEQKNKFVVAGTYLRVSSPYKEAAGIVHDEFKRLEAIFNIYDPESELSRLNATYNQPQKASAELLEILQLSREVYQMSQGAFDVSHGALYEFWKEFIANGVVAGLPQHSTINELRRLGGIKNIKIDRDKKEVTITKKGLKIDLGGIAKGYMVDKAAARLKEQGIDRALIDAGGDIYCLGTNKGRPWRVGIRGPDEIKEIYPPQELTDEAIATSGDYEQFFNFAGKRYSHLVDPRRGWPVESNVISVTVVSKNCTTSDGFATAFFVLGLGGIKEFINTHPSTMKIFVLTDGAEGRRLHIF